MITNKDVRVENGNIILNGDKFPLDGQSPEAIMEIVEDNSDSTPTENSTAPVTSGGVFTALGTKQDTLTFDTVPTENSTNPVESGGLYNLLSGLTDGLDLIVVPVTWPTTGTTLERVENLITQAINAATITKPFSIIELSDAGVVKSVILYSAVSTSYAIGVYMSYYQDFVYKLLNQNGTITVKQIAEVS